MPEAANCEPLYALKTHQEHSARYLFASQVVVGRSVLDIENNHFAVASPRPIDRGLFRSKLIPSNVLNQVEGELKKRIWQRSLRIARRNLWK